MRAGFGRGAVVRELRELAMARVTGGDQRRAATGEDLTVVAGFPSGAFRG